MTTPTPARRLWDRYVTSIQATADGESAAYMETTPRPVANRRAAIVLVAAAFALTVLNFGATTRPAWFVTATGSLGLGDLSASLESAFADPARGQLYGLIFWGVVQVVAYVAIPVVVIKLVLGERVADFGVRVRGIWKHGGTYGLLFLVSVPFIVAASSTAAFQAKYPFYDLGPAETIWPNMVIWWAVYATQFVALEFFFRGFLVHGLKGRFGYMAVFVMIVPYNMLHFTKPMTEALAAILGGYVLGSLSLKTRSVWWGAALHIAVAATMDLLSLSQRGLL